MAAPSTLKVLAKEVGQVFPITLDDSAIPNIYLGQTAAFGLQIVGPGNNRLRKGQAGARWMPGQFGAAGGPGSIYKIDGHTGAVTLFASIPGNGGAGLGDIVFDKASRSDRAAENTATSPGITSQHYVPTFGEACCLPISFLFR